jgi:hypothetical protein
MAVLKHPETGEKREVEGEIPIHHQYLVEGFDEDDEFVQTPYVDLDGQPWIIVDDGVETFRTGSDDPSSAETTDP